MIMKKLLCCQEELKFESLNSRNLYGFTQVHLIPCLNNIYLPKKIHPIIETFLFRSAYD